MISCDHDSCPWRIIGNSLRKMEFYINSSDYGIHKAMWLKGTPNLEKIYINFNEFIFNWQENARKIRFIVFCVYKNFEFIPLSMIFNSNHTPIVFWKYGKKHQSIGMKEELDFLKSPWQVLLRPPLQVNQSIICQKVRTLFIFGIIIFFIQYQISSFWPKKKANTIVEQVYLLHK